MDVLGMLAIIIIGHRQHFYCASYGNTKIALGHCIEPYTHVKSDVQILRMDFLPHAFEYTLKCSQV